MFLELPDFLHLGRLATVGARPAGPSARRPRPLFPRLARSFRFPEHPLSELGGEHLGSLAGFYGPGREAQACAH